MFCQKGAQLYYCYDNQQVCVEPWGPDALRVRITQNPSFTAHNWALSEPVPAIDPAITIYRDENVVGGTLNHPEIVDRSYAKIVNGKLTAEFNADGVLTFYNDKQEVLLKEYWRRTKDNPSLAFRSDGRELKPLEGDQYQITLRFWANDREKIFGMGQYQQKYMDMKGCQLELAHRNSQASVPFYISNLGYGFL